MVNSNMSRILMGSSVGRGKEKADNNLVVRERFMRL